ncbi:hypothetical protein HWV62_27779 [Athelia sp. TMB]|nr:hypothetical protein HWV62_27779 [Athelia sp. TMB]
MTPRPASSAGLGFIRVPIAESWEPHNRPVEGSACEIADWLAQQQPQTTPRTNPTRPGIGEDRRLSQHSHFSSAGGSIGDPGGIRENDPPDIDRCTGALLNAERSS